MAAILEVSVVRFKRVFDIRWLSLGNCVYALSRNYVPLMVVLEESAGDATTIGKSDYRPPIVLLEESAVAGDATVIGKSDYKPLIVLYCSRSRQLQEMRPPPSSVSQLCRSVMAPSV